MTATFKDKQSYLLLKSFKEATRIKSYSDLQLGMKRIAQRDLEDGDYLVSNPTPLPRLISRWKQAGALKGHPDGGYTLTAEGECSLRRVAEHIQSELKPKAFEALEAA